MKFTIQRASLADEKRPLSGAVKSKNLKRPWGAVWTMEVATLEELMSIVLREDKRGNSIIIYASDQDVRNLPCLLIYDDYIE